MVSKSPSIMATVSSCTLNYLFVLLEGTGGSVIARIDSRSIQTSSSWVGHFKSPAYFLSDSMKFISAPELCPNTTSSQPSRWQQVLLLYQCTPLGGALSNHMETLGCISHLWHTARRGHEVLLAMILIGEGCHCMDGHCPCNSCDFPKAINSRLRLEAGSLWHKVKETELADWWCCVQERKSTVSWIVSFCYLTASSAMCFTEPPTPSQEPFAMAALK